MAIQVNGTTVIDNSRNLNNIVSVDATTAAAIGAAGVGGGGTIDLVADGSISAGDPVGITSQGKVKRVTQLYGNLVEDFTNPSSIGHEYSSGEVIYDTVANAFIYAARDYGVDYNMEAYVLDLSGFTVNTGSRHTFGSGEGTGNHMAHNPTDQKNLIVRFSSSTGYANAFTVSGTTITSGSSTSLSTCNGQPMVDYNPDQNNYLYTFRNGSSSLNCRLLTTSSSNYNVSYSGNTVIASGNIYADAIAYDTNTNKHLVVYKDDSNQVGKATVVTNNGSSVSIGGTGTFTNGTTQPNSHTADVIFDPSSGKFLIVWAYQGGNVACRTATISGTSVSFGPELILTEFKKGQLVRAAHNGSGSILLCGEDILVSTDRAMVVAISGTSVSVVSTFLTQNAGGSYDGACGLDYSPDDNKYMRVIGGWNKKKDAYSLDTSSPFGSFIGFAQSSVSSGQTLTVDIISALNESQSGLIKGLAYGMDPQTGTLNAASTPKVAIATDTTKALVIGGTA